MATVKANKMIRPFRKVSQDNINAILKDIAEGAPRKHAAEANGISARHFHYLIAQGIVEMENGIFHTLQAHMVRSLRKIEMDEIKGCRNNIRENDNSHKGAQWTLEHVYWKWFGNNVEAKELAQQIEELRAEIKGSKANGEVDSSEAEENTEE